MTDVLESIIAFRDLFESSDGTARQKIDKLRQLFSLIVTEETEATKVRFTSLFARLSFLISTHAIPARESYILHSFRKSFADRAHRDHVDLGIVSLDIILKYVYAKDVDISDTKKLYQTLTKGKSFLSQSFEKEIKVLIKDIDTSSKHVTAQLSEEPFDIITIVYNRPDRNEDYTAQLQIVKEKNLLPLVANLIDVEIDDQGYHYPSGIIYEPDYLYDVTAVAECFSAFANHQGGYLLRKFVKRKVTKPILEGNIANFFLDQLVYNKDVQFGDFIKSIFSIDPLSISLLTDQEVKEMMVMLELHFHNIKSVVQTKFERLGISKDLCLIEPAFYSAKYGIQGRLDLFSINETRSNIVELKSGKAYRPNSYGLANNHYHQTLLYDMLIASVYKTSVKRNNFILYSKVADDHLRFAPALRSEQREAMKERNELYLHDRLLLESDDFIEYYRSYVQENKAAIKGFQRKDFEDFLKVMTELDALERSYLSELLRLVLKELSINKLGDPGHDKSSGLASLWLSSIEEKRDQFNILDYLKIDSVSTTDADTIIVMKKSDRSHALSNFRVGDLGVLYPAIEGVSHSVLRHQVFKATVLDIVGDVVQIRLRSRQENQGIFKNYDFWHLEHDTLDNGYYEMTRSIYEYARAPQQTRKLLLGREAPCTYDVAPVSYSDHLTEEQSQIFQEIISSKDYYLLWGPPGTGKTSIMLREVAHHYITHENDRVLLLAYTNRAVDEICDALSSLDPKPSFIRIGSKYSTAKRYHAHLLADQIKDITNRRDLRERLIREQVYVGTVASVLGKVSLFELIKFDVAIIDEASQLLETSLIGLLTRVNKWILIGDHLQLPAIVRQSASESEIAEHKELNELGLHNLSASFFERLYKHAASKKWDHCIGQLTHQGRMHKDIMEFVNHRFYDNRLSVIPSIARLSNRDDELYLFANQRLVFISSDSDITSESIKVNRDESKKVIMVCEDIVSNLTQKGVEISLNTIGVITPYRAQIAAIKLELEKSLPALSDRITIDTVERYQGGARDYIIMSTCANFSFQLRSLVSLSEDGVDRKLNVAITRSREQFILIGNKSVLSQDQNYESLIKTATEYSFA